jgi:glycerol-3-phosphate responsive antiterminator
MSIPSIIELFYYLLLHGKISERKNKLHKTKKRERRVNIGIIQGGKDKEINIHFFVFKFPAPSVC